MSTQCDHVRDDLAAIVDGDRDVIARHADHLASCDDCRDARYEAGKLAQLVGSAGADHAPNGNAVDRLMAALDAAAPSAATTLPGMAAPTLASAVAALAEPTVAPPAPAPVAVAPKPAPAPKSTARPADVTPISNARKNRIMRVTAALAAVAATSTGIYVATHRHSANGDSTQPATAKDGSIGKLATVARAAADKADGVMVKTQTGWQPIRANATLLPGAELKTDERTRASLELADGTRVVLDHLTTVAFDPSEPRHVKLEAGRIVADVAHVDNHPAEIATPNALIDVVGTRFEATATDALTSVQVVRGEIVLRDKNGGHESVRAGEEGVVDHGALSVSPVPAIGKEVQWSELEGPKQVDPDETTAGVGALRAYKPGEKRDRDWKLALAKHDVKVRIVGPIARTEITEVFRNDSPTQLEGVYQFPLPSDAQIDGLSLDMKDAPNGFVDGAFVDKARAQKIWNGVIDRAAPLEQHPVQEIVWVPGPWRDPALLDWKRGGRFELRIFPIPAKGSRTIKIAYTQVVTPRGPWRQYIYPLPHSADGSTVADDLSVDLEVRGAANGLVRTVGYNMVADPQRKDVNGMRFEQGAFVPRGDLVVDYRPDSDAEVRAWTFTGGAAVAPDDKLAQKKNVGIDPKVVDAQKAVAADARPTAVLALQPKLPRWREAKPRDYVIVVDDSESMVGERWKRASELAATLVEQMDRRDRFTLLACDSECRSYGSLRSPSASAANDLGGWLKGQTIAGASDIVTAVRSGANELTDTTRERWVLYVGDGFATTGFRRTGDVEHAIADSTGGKDIHVSTIGIGTDADEPVLSAAARGGGGAYMAWLPGQTVAQTAVATLESTYGATLRDAHVELPTGLADIAPAVLPTIRAGQEVLLSARLSGDVQGDVVLKGTVAGKPFEQRYPLKLAVSQAAGNGFVPRLWATLTIDQLERDAKGDDHAKLVALSQGYGVMSRETSLLVLESQAMFDAFGVDRHTPTAKWTGEDAIDEASASGTMQLDTGGSATRSASSGPAGDTAATAAPPATHAAPAPAPKADVSFDEPKAKKAEKPADKDARDLQQEPAMNKGAIGAARGHTGFGAGGGGMALGDDFRPRGNMIAMRKVWTRIAAVSAYDGVNSSITTEIAKYEDALAKNPDSREKHRALVQALSYAGETAKARDIAQKWYERDRLDPQALGYIADLAGRDGERDGALRTLDGLVDLDADKVALHERMVNAYERSGHLAQACGHRVAIASINAKDTSAAGTAARCLRTLGREHDADLVMHGLPDDTARTAAEKLATVAPVDDRQRARVTGDLVINGKWSSPADLDVSLVAPDGSRVSWMGGRSDLVVADSTATDREELAVRTLRRGNYLVEIVRGDAARSPVRGTLDITVLGVRKSLPFELTGTRATVGRIAVTLESHLEAVDGGIGMQPPQQVRVTISNIQNEAANRVVHARAGIVRACYQRELNRNPGISGRMALVIAVDDQGIATVQRHTPSGNLGAGVDDCITRVMSRLRFPANAPTTFAVQIAFTPN